MLKKTLLSLSVFSLLLPSFGRADEGMWLPMLISRLNYVDMQQMGLQLTADEIYSVNNSSLKDAIVVLNGGSCTAEMISGNGLVLTNHHCAYGVIQANSTTQDNILERGFWAKTHAEEKRAEGMTAGFLVRMADVTDQVLADVSDSDSEADRSKKIRQKMGDLVKEAEEGTHYNAQVKSFFEGNEFYLFVYETFRDVRLVGNPPESVGKYGGDTDNWMWPRHTGDFSMLRVYTGPDGKPADYSEDNIPLKPRHHLPISLNGVKDGDYAMVMGYPGSTDRYLTSYGVQMQIENIQPNIVKIRDLRLRLMKEDMDANPTVRLQYASKYARVSNYWKYFKGQTRGLKRLKVYDKKKAEEDAFQAWVKKSSERNTKYGAALSLIDEAYGGSKDLRLARTYLNECVFGSELVLMAFRASRLKRALDSEDPTAIARSTDAFRERVAKHFKDYNMPTDRKVTAALLAFYGNDLPSGMQPPVMLEKIKGKFKGDYKKYADYVFAKSVFASEERLNAFLASPSAKKLDKDPGYELMSSFLNHYRGTIQAQLGDKYEKEEKGNRLYVAGLREMNPDKKYYPNANSTMRVSFGKVLDYYPSDAVYYNYYTTLDGVMEKEDPSNPEFIVEDGLKTLYQKEDYGQYARKDGKLPVCFITNNDITGGNSGSPVINANGELIGCAFDGNWEAMSGDIAFEHKLQRCIVVDIRYVLFIVDKYAGASHLVDEMTLVKGTPEAKKKVMQEGGSGE